MPPPECGDRPAFSGPHHANADDSDPQRVIAALRDENRRLQTTLDSITDGLLVLDRQWRHSYISETGARMLGMRREDLIGACVWHLFPDAVGTGLHEGYHTAVATRQPAHLEEYFPAPLHRWLECHCYPSDDGLTVFFRDITDRKRASLNADFLRRLDPALMARREPGELLHHALTALHEHLGVYAVAFAELLPDGAAQVHSLTPTSPRVNTLTIALTDYLSEDAQAALTGGSDFIVQDVSADERIAGRGPAFLAAGIAACAIVPVTDGTELKALLAVTDARDRIWRTDEVRVIRNLAARIFPALARARAEETLRERTTLLHAISDASRDVIFAKDLDGRMRFANPATLALIGKSVDQVLHRTDAEFLDDKDAARQVMENDRQVMQSGVAVELEEIVPLPDRTHRVWLSHKAPYVDASGQITGLLGISRDITARKEAEEQLRATLDSIGDGFIAVDREWRFVYLNAAAERTIGMTRDELVGRSHWDVFPGSVGTRVEDEYKRAAAGEIVAFESFYEPWGRWFYNRCFPRPGGGMSVYFQDITERKRGEEALRTANLQLLDADRRKNEFIAVLSHELRNPIAPIRYAVPLLRAEPLGPVAAAAVEVVDRQAAQLARLIDDLLDVARITRGMIELRRERLTLTSVVSAALETASATIEAAGLTLNVELASEPIWLDADATRLSQVLTNLLDNAAKYTPRGGRVEVRAGRDDTRGQGGSGSGAQAVIRVRDTGVGIPAEALTTVFDMFRQVNRTNSGLVQGGLGIGLGLVRQLVEMHGGRIEANSNGPGTGAEFVVRLPEAEAPVTDAPETVAGQAAASTPHALRVLIVDDNADLVDMLALLVSELGHETATAEDGASAVTLATSFRPDVVLLDVGLPVMSGFEVARALRQHRDTAGAFLVAMTGWGQPEDRARTREAGFDHHLTKPAGPEVLEQLLARIVPGR